jgi:hypothetical protein
MKTTVDADAANFLFSQMFKLLSLVCFSVILLMMATVKVSAKTCEEDYLNMHPGGVVPTTNSSLVSNCTVLTTVGPHTGIEVNWSNHTCYNKTPNLTTTYCDNENGGTPSVAIAAGEIVVYSTGTNFIKIQSGGHQYNSTGEKFGQLTGINILAGDQFVVRYGELGSNDGAGWRAYDGNVAHSDFQNFENDAAAHGYTILSEESWADASYKTNNMASFYDTYDFDDAAIMIAVKATLVKPACSALTVAQNLPTNITSTGYPIYLGDNASFSVYNQSGDASLYHFISNTYSPAVSLSSCNPQLGGTTQTCGVLNKVNTDNPTQVTWYHNYQNCNGAGCSDTCTAQINFNIYPYPGFLKTDKGDTYLRGVADPVKKALDQIKFPLTAPIQAFSKFTFSSGQAQNLHYPSGSQGEYLSFKKYLLFSYNDINNTYDYSWLATKLLSDPKLTSHKQTITVTGNTNFSQTNLDDLLNNGIKLVQVTNDLTLDSSSSPGKTLHCKYPTIFIIGGDLYINPNLVIDGDNGCMFVVNGKTTIRKINANDQVNAFIITGNYYSDLGDGTLTVKGGVINQNSVYATAYYKRNKNLLVVDSGSIDKTNPSETLIYEGARYINLFGAYLQEPFTMSIRETQYTSGQ